MTNWFFRYSLTTEYNLELVYRKPFLEIWHEEKDDPELGPLSERMGVRARGGGELLVSDEELDAASKYSCCSVTDPDSDNSQASIMLSSSKRFRGTNLPGIYLAVVTHVPTTFFSQNM